MRGQNSSRHAWSIVESSKAMFQTRWTSVVEAAIQSWKTHTAGRSIHIDPVERFANIRWQMTKWLTTNCHLNWPTCWTCGVGRAPESVSDF